MPFAVKLHKHPEGGYQTKPLFETGIGRFRITKTDNANARAIGRNPKWTVQDLFRNVCKRGEGYQRFETLDEVKSWIEDRLAEWGMTTENSAIV